MTDTLETGKLENQKGDIMTTLSKEVKLSRYAIRRQGEREYRSYSFLSSALDGG
jgi:hypothetical protein